MFPPSGEPAGHGEAGRAGDEVRSDLHVSVQLASEGGLHIECASKVDALYGASIDETVAATLRALDVRHARVHVDDRGALPFVIAARVEAAVRRAGIEGGDGRPARTVPLPPPSPAGRLRRSRLYVPGDQPRFAINAGLHGPDGIILDLEDSVHPDHKDAARLVVRNALRCVDFMGAERMVRINQLPLGLADLDAVVPEMPDLVLIPKTESPEQVREVAERIGHVRGTPPAEALAEDAPREADRTDTADALPPEAEMRPMWLMPIVETALGIERAFEIAAAADGVVALTIGLEDYTADVGVNKTRDGTESLYARMRIVNAARAAGVQAIDSVFGDVADEEALRKWAAGSRALGFEGMGCIHPRQIRPVHEAFAPTAEEIERAQRIVEAFEEAEARGLGVVSLGTRMIDPPVVLRARALVDRARAAGLLDGGPR